MKKVISYLITAMMVFTMIPSIAFAGTADGQQAPQNVRLHIEQSNPLYADGNSEPVVEVVEQTPLTSVADEITPNGFTVIEAASTVEEAAEVLRPQLVYRQTMAATKIYVQESDLNADSMAAIGDQIFQSAMQHTGKVNEGDSLQWAWENQDCTIDVTVGSGGYIATLTYNISYYSTEEQEAALTDAVEELKEELNLDGKTDYEKVKAIYDYMTANIAYDYTNYSDPSYGLKYTAYAALVNKTSVCQGYATLFYRMACEYGIDARIVAGTSINAEGQPEAHSWNIVKLGDKYYYLDATWDSTYDPDTSAHDYFLKGTENFANHTLEAQFTTPEFTSAYPMSNADYVPGTDDDQSGSEEPDTPGVPENPDQPSDEVTGIWTDYAAKSFAGGSGTAEDPYVIKTAEQLALLAKKVNVQNATYSKAYYVLGNDINLAGHNWVPIGAILGNWDNNYWGFDGTFDGRGYKISNLNIIDEVDDHYQYGLFGMNLGDIKNVVLENANIQFASIREGWQSTNGMGTIIHVGGICGYSTENGCIDNCEVINITIDVKASMSLNCGGAIGTANYVTVESVEVTGTVKGEALRALWVGGVIGDVGNYTTIENCCFTGSVSSENDGEIGTIDGEDLTAQGYSYVHYVGGFCGGAGRAASEVVIRNCFAIADIYSKSTVGDQNVGGFAGAVGIIYNTAIYENLWCKGKVTVTRNNVTAQESDFWQGEQPFGEQTDANSWYYKNCIVIGDDEIVVRNYSPDVDTNQSYKLKNIDISDLFRQLGFDESVWILPYGELPTLIGHQHKYGEWIVKYKATCITDGSQYKACKCGHKVTEIIKALGHDKVQHIAKAATCTEKGWETYEACSRCDYTTYKEIPATGHIWDEEWTVTEPATLEADGLETSCCANCDATQTRGIAMVKSISRTSATQVYNGSKRTPVTVKDVDGNALKAGTDYEVQYLTNCKNVGTHKIKVVLMGKYKGEKTISFTINPKATTINKLTKPAKKQIKVTWKKQTAQVTGYQIRYSTKQSMANAKTLKVTSYKTNTKTIKNLKSKQKYYVQIRTYKNVNGKAYYSTWTKAKTITTK